MGQVRRRTSTKQRSITTGELRLPVPTPVRVKQGERALFHVLNDPIPDNTIRQIACDKDSKKQFAGQTNPKPKARAAGPEIRARAESTETSRSLFLRSTARAEVGNASPQQTSRSQLTKAAQQ